MMQRFKDTNVCQMFWTEDEHATVLPATKSDDDNDDDDDDRR